VPLLENNATTIAISKRNRETLCDLGKKGQSFDQILTQVLNIATENRGKEKEGSQQPKRRVDRSALVAGYVPSIRTAEECDSIP
jgi:hypothetical protein